MPCKNRTSPLRSRTPQQWRELVDRYPYPLNVNLACLIWWEWLSNTPVSQRTDLFDDYLMQGRCSDKPDRPNCPTSSSQDLYNALLEMGYTPQKAFRRIGNQALRKTLNSTY